MYDPTVLDPFIQGVDPTYEEGTRQQGSIAGV